MKVEFIQGSISPAGTILDTLVCEYPRTAHAELLTHRVFTKNSSSTRAVPISAVIEQISNYPADYLWTTHRPGMSGNPIDDQTVIDQANHIKNEMFEFVSNKVRQLADPKGLNIHKQHAGRFLEPFQNIRIVLSATEWENFDWLRIDADAFPEIHKLASMIQQARNSAVRLQLAPGEAHVPFVDRVRINGELCYFHPETKEQLTKEEAIELSMSVSAQTSYRKEDTSTQKTKTVIDKLFNGRKVHASPSEHPAIAVDSFINPDWSLKDVIAFLPEGITHIDIDYNLWSGNYRDWIQYRQLLPNHDKAKF
jgi:thymidylate synthase ThyX